MRWEPTPIISMASSHDGTLLVAAREDGELDLYDASTLQKLLALPGSSKSSTTTVAIAENASNIRCRIFTAGLDGAIFEHNIDTLGVSASLDSHGGAVWQLSMKRDEEAGSYTLAAACDDGSVRLFGVESDFPGMNFSKALPKVEGRCLTAVWHPGNSIIASAGTDGCIHVWNVHHGREVLRISAGDGSSSEKEFCIWILIYLPDGTLVSGDSSGNVSFWDSMHGTLIARFARHSADILSLAASPEGDIVFASGVDPQIAVYQRSSEGWVYLSSKRSHTNDVRALCVTHSKAHTLAEDMTSLWSAGNDFSLLRHSVERFLKQHPVSVSSSCAQCPIIQASHSSKTEALFNSKALLLSIHKAEADVWQVGMGNMSHGQMMSEGQHLHRSSPPTHLVRLVNDSGAYFVCGALSTTGKYMVLSDTEKVYCFYVDTESNPPHLQPLALPEEVSAASKVAFINTNDDDDDCSFVVCSLKDGLIHVVTRLGLEDGAFKLGYTIRDVHDLRYKLWAKRDRNKNSARQAAPVVEHLVPSPDGRWLAVVSRQRIMLVSTESHRIATQMTPLGDQAPIVALDFSSDSTSLVVVSSNNTLSVFDVVSGQPTEWTKKYADALMQRLKMIPGNVMGVSACLGRSLLPYWCTHLKAYYIWTPRNHSPPPLLHSSEGGDEIAPVLPRLAPHQGKMEE